eukprot:365615-Chlamydomonas_euryale.AAC.1
MPASAPNHVQQQHADVVYASSQRRVAQRKRLLRHRQLLQGRGPVALPYPHTNCESTRGGRGGGGCARNGGEGGKGLLRGRGPGALSYRHVSRHERRRGERSAGHLENSAEEDTAQTLVEPSRGQHSHVVCGPRAAMHLLGGAVKALVPEGCPRMAGENPRQPTQRASLKTPSCRY